MVATLPPSLVELRRTGRFAHLPIPIRISDSLAQEFGWSEQAECSAKFALAREDFSGGLGRDRRDIDL